MNPINSRNVSGVKWRLTSSTVNRGIRKVCSGNFSSSKSSKDLEGSSLEGPKARIYSFESITRTKFFFPNGLSRFAQCLNHIFLAHAKNRRRVFSYNLSYFSQMFFSLFNVCFCHAITPDNKISLLYLGGDVKEGESECQIKIESGRLFAQNNQEREEMNPKSKFQNPKSNGGYNESR